MQECSGWPFEIVVCGTSPIFATVASKLSLVSFRFSFLLLLFPTAFLFFSLSLFPFEIALFDA